MRSHPCRHAPLDFPVFDADNHMYETTDAFTKYLPSEYEGLIKYVQVDGRTKIAVNNLISDYIPNPTFAKVAAPGAQEEYFKSGNPEGKSRREILGRGIDALPGFSEPEPRLALMDELGTGPGPDVADPGQPARGADPDQPSGGPRGGARPQPVDARALDVQLREPDVPGSGGPSGHRGPGHRGAGLAGRAWSPDHPRPSGPGVGLDGSPVAGPARVRSVLEARGRGRPGRRDARLGQRLPALRQRVGGYRATAR